MAAIHLADGQYGIATLDMSSGRFQLLQVGDDEELHSELQRLNPVEILISEEFPVLDWLDNWQGRVANHPGYLILIRQSVSQPTIGHKRFKCFWLYPSAHSICAAGCLLQYAKDTQRGNLPHIHSISVENREDGVALDAASRRNLELDTNLNGGKKIHYLMF